MNEFYFKKIAKDGSLESIITYYKFKPNINNSSLVEISKDEYNELSNEIETKANLENSLYNNQITMEDIPSEWQEEILYRVKKRISVFGDSESQPISPGELQTMLEGVL